MGEWVKTGALVDGVRPKTKKALRDAVAAWTKAQKAEAEGQGKPDAGAETGAETPAVPVIVFDVTDRFGAHAGKQYAPHEVPEGVSVSVCGPDPYGRRSWYATVTRKGDTLTVART